MTLQIQIKHDLERAERALGVLGRQVPFAAALALTRSAKQVERAEIATMRRVFDRPTRYTLAAQYVQPARKRALRAVVWLRGSGRKKDRHYLEPQVYGGKREPTDFERLLTHRGILPAGWVAVPGKYLPRTASGKVSRGIYQKILAQLGAYHDPLQHATGSRVSRRNRRHFAFWVQRDRAPYGIWARQGRRVFPAFIFVRSASYRRRLPFFAVAQRTSAQAWPGEFNQAISRAIKTAR